MAINCLPNKLLVKVYSYLKPPDLLRAENVCHRWLKVIQDHIWNELTLIDEETIGFPDDNFVNILIQLGHRVRKVSKFINIYALLSASMRENARLLFIIRKSIIELIEKRTANAIFDLDLIKDAIAAEHFAHKKELNQLNDAEETRLALNKVFGDFQVDSFEAIRLNEFFFNEKKNESNPFIVQHKGGELSVPLSYPNIKELHIGCLVFNLDPVASTEPVTQLMHTLKFTCLELVELEALQVCLRLPLEAFSLHGPRFEMKFHVNHRRRRCQFTGDEFYYLLYEMSSSKHDHRMSVFLSKMKDWKIAKILEIVHLKVESSDFKTLCSALPEHLYIDSDNQEEDAHYIDHGYTLPRQLSAKFTIRYCLYAVQIEKLDLTLTDASNDDEQAKNSKNLFKAKRLFANLREFSLSLHYHFDENEHSTNIGRDRVIVLMKLICHQLTKNIEKLKLNFQAKGGWTPSFLDESTATDLLPRLSEFVYRGFPCLPFVLSVVRHAPNLRHLSVECQLFQDVGDGLMLSWILKLVESLAGCSGLVTLSIHVLREEILPAYRDKQCEEILEMIDTGLKCISSSLPHLLCVSVMFDGFNYHLNADKRCFQSTSVE